MLPLGACGTTSRLFRDDPAPQAAPPLVFPPACLADHVTPAEVIPPPMPETIVRPAGEPSARAWVDWLRYEARRRERAELAGLHYQGERNAYRDAYGDTAAQLEECVTFSRAH